jgi:hypothetical protein
MVVQGMGLSKGIMILLSGKMMPTQQNKAKQMVRVEKILEAVKWLFKSRTLERIEL